MNEERERSGMTPEGGEQKGFPPAEQENADREQHSCEHTASAAQAQAAETDDSQAVPQHSARGWSSDSVSYGDTGYGGEQGKQYAHRNTGTQSNDPDMGRNGTQEPYHMGEVPPYQGGFSGGYSGRNPYSDMPGSKPPSGGMYGTSEWSFTEYDTVAPPRRSKRGRSFSAIGMVLGVGLSIGIVAFAGYSIWSLVNGNRCVANGNSSSQLATVPGLNIQDRPNTVDMPVGSGGLSNVEIIHKVSPSVVGIAAYSGSASFSPSSQGSGIIMTADGYIVTNAHVVSKSKGITVYLENGDTYAARLVGQDEQTDLAVLKIEANNLTYAEFGNSDKLERGESVLAIGNPGGMQLAGSVTGGMVSGVNRSLSGNSPYSTSYIQVDAAINPGNSGGALVNSYGQVVGINSAKIAQLDYEGIGFAIPINEALPIIKELMQNGHVTGRPELGVTGVMIDDTLAMFRRLPKGFGIESIDEKSDLVTKAAPGDIITHIDGEEVTGTETISNILAKHKPGDTVRLKIYRQSLSGNGGRSFETDVTLIESTR